MKILQVLDSYPPDLNGGAYFTHRLSKQLTEMGHDVLVICPSRSRMSHDDEYEGVRLFRVQSYPALLYGNFRICLPFRIGQAIEKVLDEFSPDVVHLQGRFVLGAICMRYAQVRHIPMVATNHFMPENFFHYTGLPGFMRDRFSRAAWRWVKNMFDMAQIWTTPTQSAADLLRANGFVEKPIHAISCGIDLTRFQPRENNSNSLPFLPHSTAPTLLYAGRLDKEKNIPVILRAFQLVRRQRTCRLVIVGDGAEKMRLMALVRGLGLENDVIFCGYLSDEDYPLIFGVADCFVHAGTAELQSIVTLEAVASGLPVVAARAVALPELVRHGENGFVFEPFDECGAEGFILNILDNPELASQMRQESLKISREHDLRATGQKFTDLYQQLVTHA